MTMTVARFREELADREAIRDCLYRYARGVDRCEEELVRGVYWEDAIDDHVLFQGGREELLAWAMPILRSMIQRQHSISNILIRIRGEQADVEGLVQGSGALDPLAVDVEFARVDRHGHVPLAVGAPGRRRPGRLHIIEGDPFEQVCDQALLVRRRLRPDRTRL